MVDYTLDIDTLGTTTVDEVKSLRHVTWTYYGTDGVNTVERHGGCNFAEDSEPALAEYATLTKDQVVAWTLAQLERDFMIEMLQREIVAELEELAAGGGVEETEAPW